MSTVLKYQPSAGGDPVAMAFNPLRLSSVPTSEGIRGTTLRGVRFYTRRGTRRVYTVVISADELSDASRLAFLEAFWSDGVRWWITPEGGAEAELIVAEGGELPREDIDGIVHLPEITMTLEEKYAG